MAPLTSAITILNQTYHDRLLIGGVNSISELRSQWTNPNDILSLLLLLGPDVIQRALAQLVGRHITPVAFSFGWAAYSISALFSSIGGAYDISVNVCNKAYS